MPQTKYLDQHGPACPACGKLISYHSAKELELCNVQPGPKVRQALVEAGFTEAQARDEPAKCIGAICSALNDARAKELAERAALAKCAPYLQPGETPADGLRRLIDVNQAWQNAIEREHQARLTADLARLKAIAGALHGQIAQHCASFFWNDVDIGLLHCEWRDALARLLEGT